jgi:large subunit ribosomal protein L22
MEVRAHLRYLRIAPRKVRLVINLIRGMHVELAIDQLSVLPKRSSLPILKLLNSAVANAEHNFKLEKKNLIIKSITADEGPKLKRWQPRAFGRAAEILKRMTHVTIVLEDIAKSAAPKKGASPMSTTKLETNTIKLPSASTKTTSTVKKTVKKTSKSPTAKSKARDAQDVTVRRSGTE